LTGDTEFFNKTGADMANGFEREFHAGFSYLIIVILMRLSYRKTFPMCHKNGFHPCGMRPGLKGGD
jgi:hypothetical protein